VKSFLFKSPIILHVCQMVVKQTIAATNF
jgi:hypothetical protein